MLPLAAHTMLQALSRPLSSLTAREARRVALAATGLARPRPAAPGAAHVAATIARLGLLQIDSVSVLARAHYLPLFSRLGPYPTALLDNAAWGRRRSLMEYWVHEASFVPLATQPLLRWRMERAAQGIGIYGELARFAAEQRPFVDAVHERIRRDGPAASSDFEDPGAGGWWGWSPTKRALEWLFWSGSLTTSHRRGFERVYDLPERVLPAAILSLPTPTPGDAHRALVERAGRALGIATADDLRDYYRLAPADFAPALAACVENGDLLPAAVEGWGKPAFLHRDAPGPRRVAGRALLAPFDPLVWHRRRTARVFGFEYRIEIYTPAHKRQHGYYVLPFLLGDMLVGRVDLKADRASGTLLVLGAHAEPHAPPTTAEALWAELELMRTWLALDRTVVRCEGELAAGLAQMGMAA